MRTGAGSVAGITLGGLGGGSTAGNRVFIFGRRFDEQFGKQFGKRKTDPIRDI